MKFFFTLLVILAGCMLAVQGSVNSQLTGYLKHPLQSALVNFSVGFIVLLVINFTLRTGFPNLILVKAAPWYLFCGGVLGALFVSSMIFSIPQIGVSTALAASIGGQLIAAVIIDHFGFFGLNIHTISLGRIMGIILLLVGIFLIQRY
ncbi:MAG: DMT family transporter [Mangrovibacterium sp.]